MGKYRVTVEGEGIECALKIELVEPALKRRSLLRFVGGGFVYARPVASNGDRLITVWESGVGLRVVIFTLSPGSIKKVLDAWSNIEPDTLQCDNGTDCVILYDEKQFAGNEWIPAKANVYEWNGKAYVRVRSVAFGKRFIALDQLGPERRKK